MPRKTWSVKTRPWWLSSPTSRIGEHFAINMRQSSQHMGGYHANHLWSSRAIFGHPSTFHSGEWNHWLFLWLNVVLPRPFPIAKVLKNPPTIGSWERRRSTLRSHSWAHLELEWERTDKTWIFSKVYLCRKHEIHLMCIHVCIYTYII